MGIGTGTGRNKNNLVNDYWKSGNEAKKTMKNRIGQEIVETEKKLQVLNYKKPWKKFLYFCEEFFLTNTKQKMILKVCFIGFFFFCFLKKLRRNLKTVKEKKDTI